MKEKLSGKFASADHAGPKDVADFLGLDDDEDVELIKRDAYEQVQALLNLVYEQDDYITSIMTDCLKSLYLCGFQLP